MNIEVLLACHATVGESPSWSLVEGLIYWIDVKAPLGGVNPSLTITAMAMSIAARTGAMARRGDLSATASRMVDA